MFRPLCTLLTRRMFSSANTKAAKQYGIRNQTDAGGARLICPLWSRRFLLKLSAQRRSRLNCAWPLCCVPVSYTHLTLPTILLL
eukprot:1651647-Amphidinium_carterae.1